jgi:diacylglycerol kinase (ATP)
MSRINNKEENHNFLEIKGKEISASWDGTHVHVDDQVIKLKKNTEIDLELKHDLLRFLIA